MCPDPVRHPDHPRSAGNDTFAIDVSRTFINTASDSANVPMAKVGPVSGLSSPGRAGGPGEGMEPRRFRLSLHQPC